jgi:sarcosine oxidase subunit beta
MDRADIVVIGGGSTGTSTAWQLGKLGAGRVVLLEKTGLAAGGTGKSSAIVRTHYTLEPLAKMALHSLGIFQHFDDVVGGDCGFHKVGLLVPVGAGDEESVQANVEMNREVGIDSQLLAPEDGKKLEPRMRWEDVAAAAWEPESGYADGYGTTVAFAAAARRAGADLRVGTQATRLVVQGDAICGVDTLDGVIQTPTVVVAAGYRSIELLAPLGVDIPLDPVRHDIAILHRTSDFGLPHPVIADYILGRYYLPHTGDVTMIGSSGPGGTEDPEVEEDRSPTREHLEWLAEGFLQRFPGEEAAVMQGGYTGPYDCTPDLQPALGAIPQVQGLYVATGFSGHGFKLAPAVGQMIAETVLQGRSSVVDIGFFDPNRFATGNLIKAAHSYTLRGMRS